nr:GAP family protein [Brevibacterium luteolum]
MVPVTATLLLLAGLALLDSTSLGTLGIPLWMLLAPRVRIRLVFIYLAVLAGFYWLVGVGLYYGGLAAFARIGGWAGIPWIELILGVVFFGSAFLPRHLWDGQMSFASRFQDRVAAEGSAATASVLALISGLIEVTGMYPYLAGIGIIISEGLPGVLTLAGYALIMVLPALVLTVARLAVRERVEPALVRFRRWIERHTGTVTQATFFIVGVLLILDAAINRFGWLG